jgi:hypothetical protein
LRFPEKWISLVSSAARLHVRLYTHVTSFAGVLLPPRNVMECHDGWWGGKFTCAFG